ncbi:protein of unknown function [Magnetospirillum sp. XM-1]|uniref:hypothetical protein n=1 Tax=Magnetospirillum sp. XM-1 TaxID=1663591 RepID=UPI00073DC5BF|nr:hypothetical protein [Magnetospirillum sp. XM-1]CUW39662.1 protein of unknown function [Magnetospirillum sp. XM-1]
MDTADPRFGPGQPPCWLPPVVTPENLWNNCTSTAFDRAACDGCGRDPSQPRRLHPNAVAALTQEIT